LSRARGTCISSSDGGIRRGVCGILQARIWHVITLISPLLATDLELHHLTPLGILHMAAFMALCEAFIGIERHLNLWSYLFQARLR
jgi:hypothetical protein